VLSWGNGGVLGGTPTPNLLIRRYLCGHPDPFRTVRDLGRVSARCSGKSEESERPFVRVAPSVAPGRT
jgi:hypothetical protein